MTDGEQHDDGGAHSGVSPGVLNLLELLDNIAHVLVAIFFIILAGSVLVYASLVLVRDMPLIAQSPRAAMSATHEAPASAPHHHALESATPTGRTPGAGDGGEPAPGARADAEESAASPFLHHSLELLSTLLFVVIVLELLKTIITYLKTHNIQAIMKEFLVVGIISSIRKILLVGAESSLGSSDPTAAYVKEATGTVVTIAGILLLIAGLIFLQWSETGRWTAAGRSQKSPHDPAGHIGT